MKKRMTTSLVIALLAAIAVFGQWLWTRGSDTFTLVQHAGRTYKVFSYGWPFPVVQCNAALGLATPEAQVSSRLLGNWMTFVVIGFAISAGIKMFRTTRRRVFSLRSKPSA